MFFGCAQVNNGEVAFGAGQSLADELVGTCTVDACTAMVCNNACFDSKLSHFSIVDVNKRTS